MLQNIRDSLSGPFVWFIVGLIVIPFAFFGIETFRTGGADPTVARVGDQKITDSQFRAGYDQRLAQLQQLMGENFRQDLIDQPRFRKAVLNDLVEELVLREHVTEAGYRASDALVFDAIQAIPAFQQDGKFSSEQYRSRLSMQGYSPTRFERQLRQNLVIDQMRNGVLGSAFLTPGAVAQAARVEGQQRELSYAVFELAAYSKSVQVTDAQVAERFEVQKARFLSPERLKVAYLELALDQLPESAAPSAEVLQVLYEAEKSGRFSTPEERRARHILINIGGDSADARRRIESLAEKISKGADFESLARSQSEDPGSKSKGGDLGWIRRGQMLDAFEDRLFGLEPGEVSAPVETEFGWHLIRLDELRTPSTRPFSDAKVQSQLLGMYQARERERRYQELSEKLDQVSFESPGSLQAAADATGLEIRSSDWFTRDSGTGIAAIDEVRNAAYAPEVLEANENSRPITISGNRVVVLRKQSHEPARQRELAEVAETIRDGLRTEQARAKAQAEADALVAALKEGTALEPAARARGATVKKVGLVGRSHADVPAPVLQTLFGLPRPAAGGSSEARVALGNGDLAVVSLQSVVDGAVADDAQALTARLQQALSGAEFEAYRNDLRSRIDVTLIDRSSTPAAE